MTRPACIGLVALGLGVAAVAGPGDTPRELGERLYRHGLLPSGSAVQASVAGGAPLAGAAAACASCHRRSGLGSVEGGRVVAPVTATALFRPRQPALPGTAAGRATGGRPAYTEATLRRVLREGIDPAGRALDALMPRYALDDAAADAVVAYLKALSAAPAPGVTADRIHFATIVTDGVAPATRQALVELLERYFDDHNAEIRQQTRRGERAVLGHSRGYRAWRRWELHVWNLAGAPEGWAAQLDDYYRRQPVFAVVSGAGRGSWQPVHGFCERRQLPCLFPNTVSPPAESGFYSLYFSPGLVLDAKLLAHDLLAAAAGDGRQIVQLYRDDDGEAAAAALHAALAATPQLVVSGQRVAAHELPAEALRRILAERPVTDLVLWLPADDLAAMAAAVALPASVVNLYLSSSLLADWERGVPAVWRPRARLIHQYDLPDDWQTRRTRLTRWLRVHELELVDEHLQANAYFAASLVGHTLEHLRENYSREYLIERLEHVTESVPWTSIYPSLGLASGQRFAAKGGYVLRWPVADGAAEGGPWIVPQLSGARAPSG